MAIYAYDDTGSGQSTEAEIVDRYLLDHLYTKAFRDNAGKYFTVVSTDSDGIPTEIEAIHPSNSRNKIKTTLTFIRSSTGGELRAIEFKRFKYYAQHGYIEQEEQIKFSFPFFVGVISFLQGLAGLDLDKVNERRVPLGNPSKLDAETIKQFQTILATKEGQVLIAEAVKNGSVTSTDLVNIAYRKAQLTIFEEMLAGEDAVKSYALAHGVSAGIERAWQHFFEANTWIFGYGLAFVFNQPLEGKKLEQTVHGYDFAGSGKRADGVLKTAGVVSSLCLVEIKTPTTDLLEPVEYRADCWRPSKELSGAIAQAQKTAQKTIENIALSPVYRGADEDGSPTKEVVYSYQPRSYLVIGNLAEFESPNGIAGERFASFELLRRQLHRPEIITFDELLARAKFIVSAA